MAGQYEKTALNALNRKKQRGVYDFATVHSILDTTPVLHVSFIPQDGDPTEDVFPVVLPMLGVTGSYSSSSPSSAESPTPTDAPASIYLHGHVSARMMKLDDGARGVPVSVAATLLDGIVLAATPFAHSCNYRSAVAFGHAKPVTDPDEKMWAMHRVTNNLVAQRWENTRVPPSNAEVTSTGILRVDIHRASAKVHVGGPNDDRRDREGDVSGRVWTGFVPTWMSYGPLMESPYNEVSQPPAYLREWTLREGNARRKEAFDSVVDDAGVRGVK